MRERVAIFVIAISQFLLSLLMVWVSMAGGLAPSLMAYGICGLVNACLLPFAGMVARAVALLWHLFFVWYILGNGRPPNNGTDWVVTVWAVLDLGAVFYLAKTILDRLRQRAKSGF